jgi:hypothetical protein
VADADAVGLTADEDGRAGPVGTRVDPAHRVVAGESDPDPAGSGSDGVGPIAQAGHRVHHPVVLGVDPRHAAITTVGHPDVVTGHGDRVGFSARAQYAMTVEAAHAGRRQGRQRPTA